MPPRYHLTTPDWQATAHLPAEDWLAAQGKYDTLKLPSKETMAKVAQRPASTPQPQPSSRRI